MNTEAVTQFLLLLAKWAETRDPAVVVLMKPLADAEPEMLRPVYRHLLEGE